jgi:hypothetical protein
MLSPSRHLSKRENAGLRSFPRLTGDVRGDIFKKGLNKPSSAQNIAEKQEETMKYIIETPHTPQECMHALDAQLAKGTEVLRKFNYGCKSGDHTGYALVDVRNEAEARNMVPEFLVPKARIVPVEVMTPETIKSIHAKAA